MKNSIKSLLPKISTIGVLLALVTISIFQYNWVVSSAATDISELYKSLTSTIGNKMILEFSEKPLFRENFLFTNDIRTDEEIIEELIKQKSDFNIKYRETFSLDIFYSNFIELEFDRLVNDQWDKQDVIPIEINRVIRSFKGDFSYIYDNSVIWQALPIKGQDRNFILLRIDTKNYYKNKVKEFSKEIMSKYEVIILDEIPINGHSIEIEGYRYTPFIQRSWYSQLPLPITVLPGMDQREPNIEVPGHSAPRPPMGMDRVLHGDIFIDILDDGIPLVTKKENLLTMQWLLNLLLLVGIGIGYFLIYFQIISLKKLRVREKEFIATITHELRTPLTVIQSAADNIEGGFLSNVRVKQYGQLITDQSTRLGSMIEDILLFSRLEGKAEKPPVLNRVFYNDILISLETFAASLMEKSGNKIVINFDDLPVTSITDRDTIELILTNLISNSNKHAYNKNESGSIRVIGTFWSEDILQFRVEDDGAGIDKKDKKHLFEPFYRGKRSHKIQIKGSGLGLFLSNKKALLLGGTLEVDSHIEHGAAFNLQVPYQKG